MEIAPRQRVVEGLVPAVEPDLPIGRRYDDQKDQARQPQQRVAYGGGPERLEHHANLRHEARTGDLVAVGSGWVLRLVAHELAPLRSTAILAGTGTALVPVGNQMKYVQHRLKDSKLFLIRTRFGRSPRDGTTRSHRRGRCVA